MITFHDYSEIRLLSQNGMSCAEVARKLNFDERTISKWASRNCYVPRKARKRPSILDPYKLAIRRDMELGENSATKIYSRLKEEGYAGKYTVVKKYTLPMRTQVPGQDSKIILPFEWMLRLLQGKLSADMITKDFGLPVLSENVSLLVKRIHDGSLKVRNKAMTVLAHMKKIPNKDISRFLIINDRVVLQYIRIYELAGITGLFAPRKCGLRKHEQDEYKTAVFDLLHSPPQSHGINRTSWRMDDIIGILRQNDIIICKSVIQMILKNAGFRFRSAKKVLTSNDPKYREKLLEITRTLSALTESQKFFSIDEYGPFAVKKHGGRALTAPDQERVVPQWQKSKGSLTFIGALELSTNQITHFYADAKNTVEMIKLTRILIEQYKDESLIFLSWDAASWHASKAFFAEVSRLNASEYRELHQTPSIALLPLPASAQFLNVIESIFSGMARAIIHNSDYASTEDCKIAIDRYIAERNEFFKANPKRAGDKIWGKERVPPVFSPSNNCKDPMYR